MKKLLALGLGLSLSFTAVASPYSILKGTYQNKADPEFSPTIIFKGDNSFAITGGGGENSCKMWGKVRQSGSVFVAYDFQYSNPTKCPYQPNMSIAIPHQSHPSQLKITSDSSALQGISKRKK